MKNDNSEHKSQPSKLMRSFHKASISHPCPQLLMGAHSFRISPLDTLQPGALCGRTASPAFPTTAQRSVLFSASRGHQSLHIAGWMLLETKEEDFGCQFVLTLCKVCLEAEKAGYRPDSGCALFWLFYRTGWGPMVVHILRGWGARFWYLLHLRVQPTGSSGWGKRSLQ